jgi:hypothetical protein
LTGASGSAIAFSGEQGTICSARSGEGAPPLGAPVDSTAGVSKQCLDSGTPLWREDVTTDCRNAPENSEAIRIRAVIVVPIYRGDDISGILGVFSSAPGIFTNLHLKWLQQLANWVGSAQSMPSEEPICGSHADVHFDVSPDIRLLISWEPAYRVFFRNFSDLVSLRSRALLGKPSKQIDGWNGIFIDTRLPWKRFIESAFLHFIVVGMLLVSPKIWLREPLASSQPLREARVIYYPFSPSFPANESSRPENTKREDTSAHRGPIGTARNPEPWETSSTRATVDGRNTHELSSTSPSVPVSAIRSFQQLARDPVVSPPSDISQAQFRPTPLLNFPVVAPPPKLSGGSGLRTMNEPRATVIPPSPDIRGLLTGSTLIDRGRLKGSSTGVADISIVPPAPSLNDRAALTYRATGLGPTTGGSVVAPSPSIQTGPGPEARAISLGNGGSQVVPPPPSLAGSGNSLGRRRSDSLVAAAGGSQLAPPLPSMQDGGNLGGRRGISSLDDVTSRVAPPPPSIPALAGGDYGSGARVGSLARAAAGGVLPPTSTEGNSNVGSVTVAKNKSTLSVPEASVDRAHPIYQDAQLRVIALAWAPPRSTYFSNFEVFLAEKWLNKEQVQFIKLVYVFLPYQRSLSEYGADALKVRRLRITRDLTCDESLTQIMWPEYENGPTGFRPSGEARASLSPDRDLLPCYLTTADDYRRAVSPSR